jgi:hypothetical protein
LLNINAEKTYHEYVADDDGGCAGLGEEGDKGPQAQAAERVEGVPAAGAATKFREILQNYFVASAKFEFVLNFMKMVICSFAPSFEIPLLNQANFRENVLQI